MCIGVVGGGKLYQMPLLEIGETLLQHKTMG